MVESPSWKFWMRLRHGRNSSFLSVPRMQSEESLHGSPEFERLGLLETNSIGDTYRIGSTVMGRVIHKNTESTLSWDSKRELSSAPARYRDNKITKWGTNQRLADESSESPNNSFVKASAFGGRPRNSCTEDRHSSLRLSDIRREWKMAETTHRERIELFATSSRNQDTVLILLTQHRVERILLKHRCVHVRSENERVKVPIITFPPTRLDKSMSETIETTNSWHKKRTGIISPHDMAKGSLARDSGVWSVD